MKVFISWSGTRSQSVATLLRTWLPQVIQAVHPFVSDGDIAAGGRWLTEIAGQLEKTDFGILCVTQANLAAPWLNFEAGALAKNVEHSRVVPLAIDLGPSDIPQPLGQFNAIRLDKDSILKMLRSINDVCEGSLEGQQLDEAFDVWWPRLEQGLNTVEETEGDEASDAGRSEREILEEVLATVRGLAAQQSTPAIVLPTQLRRTWTVGPTHRMRHSYREVAQQLTAVLGDDEVTDMVFRSSLRDGERVVDQVIISTAREVSGLTQRFIERMVEPYELEVQFNFEG